MGNHIYISYRGDLHMGRLWQMSPSYVYVHSCLYLTTTHTYMYIRLYYIPMGSSLHLFVSDDLDSLPVCLLIQKHCNIYIYVSACPYVYTHMGAHVETDIQCNKLSEKAEPPPRLCFIMRT